MVHFYSNPCSLRGVGACRAQGLSQLSDRLYSPSSTLCLLGEGVSWIWSRQVGKQCSEESREFQLSPAFFSPLPDGSQMFLKQPISLTLLSFYLFPPLCLSPFTYSAPSFCLPFQFPLSSGITPFTKVLASPCLIVITPRQINSRFPHLFSLFLFCFSLSRSSVFALLGSFSVPHSISLITPLVWYREMAFCFSYNILHHVMSLRRFTTETTGFTIKCIAHAKFMWF